MTVTLHVVIERKDEALAAFVVVPAAAVAAWGISATTTVEGTLDGAPIGRRSLVRWDHDRWYLELRHELTQAVGKAVGDRATLVIRVASAELPAELRGLLETDPDALGRWESYTPARQRMIREEVLGAKTAAARERRARKALTPSAQQPPPSVAGLLTTPASVLVRVTGRRLPGVSCGPYSAVRVGMVQQVGCDPETVPADVPEITWETGVEVREVDGRAAFRGPAVNGPPHERFIYLTWLGRAHGAHPAMFRRAKLRLDAIPSAVLSAAIASGVLLGEVDLTDRHGMPLCGSVKPPVIAWQALRAGERPA
jgi:Family of unknown function (DUF5990)/Bacteriocin-protection, YdeI or OmpD-Associated/Domain of unknown function (DUF1905)